MRATPLFLMLICMSCNIANSDLKKERAIVIQQLLDLPNQSLVDRNVEGAVGAVPENGDVFIAAGEIFRRTKDQERKHMENEIRQVEYQKFTHLVEPDIKFLDDGRSCYGTAQIKIDYAVNADTTRRAREFIYSILFVGEKQDGKWVMTAFSQSDKTVEPDVE